MTKELHRQHRPHKYSQLTVASILIVQYAIRTLNQCDCQRKVCITCSWVVQNKSDQAMQNKQEGTDQAGSVASSQTDEPCIPSLEERDEALRAKRRAQRVPSDSKRWYYIDPQVKIWYSDCDKVSSAIYLDFLMLQCAYPILWVCATKDVACFMPSKARFCHCMHFPNRVPFSHHYLRRRALSGDAI